jgi:hypothetical protein
MENAANQRHSLFHVRKIALVCPYLSYTCTESELRLMIDGQSILSSRASEGGIWGRMPKIHRCEEKDGNLNIQNNHGLPAPIRLLKAKSMQGYRFDVGPLLVTGSVELLASGSSSQGVLLMPLRHLNLLHSEQ